jgi:cephalosporin-C deacetylase
VPAFDFPLAELRTYRPEIPDPSDFDEFWASTIAESRAIGGEITVTPFDAGLTEVEVFDVTFPGFGGHPIKGWFIAPASKKGPLPTIVEFIGYGGGRSFPHERLQWSVAGYAYFYMDARGQGSVWGAGGETADPVGSDPAAPGFLTKGIQNKNDYYYRRVYTDAVRAIDAVRTFERVDASRVAVTGGSQGGGIALAAAGLVPDLVAAMPEVPFLSHFERAVQIVDREPYLELVRYLSVHKNKIDTAFETLSYFDGVNLAKRALAPALFSVALFDPICPPSTVFASFNHYKGAHDIEVYHFNEHEGGGAFHWRKMADWLSTILAS